MQTMTPSPYEYFMLENRQRIEWDSVTAKRVIDCALPGEGLLLSHITFDASSWKANTFNNHEVLCYDIVEAINNITTTGGPEDTYPGTAGITSFIPTLNSAERLLDQQVFNISQADNLDILFSYGKYDGSGFSFDKETLRTLTTTFDKGPKEYSTDTVVAVGNKIDSEKITISVYSGNFSFSPDKGKTWYRNGTEFVDTCAADRSYRRELIIRYEPVRQNCDMATGSLQIKSEKSQSKVIALKGTAPRPVYIRQPKITDVRYITPYSFTCSWEDIDDAEQYYLTIYSKTEGKTEIVQSFEGINDSTDVGSGWTYNIAQPSKQECDDGVFSVVLNETGHFIRTPQYLLPITNLSFWFTTHYTEPEEQGMLYLRGFDINDNATLVDSIRLRSTSRYVTKTYDFADKQYQSFVLSYKAVTAKGNVFVDNWRASYDSTLVFVYKDEEREVVAPNHTAIVNSLKPNTKYNIIIQAAEGKGCSTNKTPLANPRLVATLPGTEGKSELSIVCREDETVIVYLPDSGDESRKLFVFTSDGRLVTALDITAGKSSVTIPAYTLQHGQVYFCKYSNAKRMKRKDYHGKFRY